MRKKLFLKLADYLEKLPRKKFNIGQWVEDFHKCGTVACAFGWCPVVFPGSTLKYIKTTGRDWNGDIEYTNKNGTFYDLEAAMAFFGINYTDAYNIFIGQSYPEYNQLDKYGARKGHGGITAKRVARRIRHFVATGEIK